LKRLLAFVVFSLAVSGVAGAQVASGTAEAGGGLYLPVPLPHSTAAAPAVVAGPVFFTPLFQTGVPCFNCVVPTGAKQTVANTFGTFIPLGFVPANQQSFQYVVYGSNLACPVNGTKPNLNVTFTLSQAGKAIAAATIGGNYAPGNVFYGIFSHFKRPAAMSGAATLTGTVMCLTATGKSNDTQPLYFE
jgi:hypothetical protein